MLVVYIIGIMQPTGLLVVVEVVVVVVVIVIVVVIRMETVYHEIVPYGLKL